jgi:hypothetical protein
MSGLAVCVGGLLDVDVVVGEGTALLVGVEEALELLKAAYQFENTKTSDREAHECLVPKTTPHATAMAMIAIRTRAARIKNHTLGRPQILPFRCGSASCDCGPAA